MHLYGGAAAMLDDVMQVQWEVEVYCARVTCGLLPGRRPLPFPEPFPKPLTDPFSEPCLVSTWWSSNGVCKRREVVIILLGRIVRDGSFSGSATAFGGYARADPEGSSGGTRIARAGLGRAGCIRHEGHGQVDEETVVGEAIGLLGSVE